MKHLNYLYILVIIGLAFTSCESNKASTSGSGYSSADVNSKDKITTTFKVNTKFDLPDPCALVSKETISQLFNVDQRYISAIDGNSDGNKKEHRACFFKWDEPDFPNTAILLQLQTNTMDETEYPDWMSYAVANKRTSGETMMGETEPHLFEIFPNVGTDGSYNYDIGKYYWRLENDLLIMLAYNMDISKDLQYNSAEKIAGEIMANLSKTVYPSNAPTARK
jgi:hypothetical protein